MPSFRPWGPLTWVLSHHPRVGDWSLLGCLGTEQRSLASWLSLTERNALTMYRLLRIKDAPSRFIQLCRDRADERLTEFAQEGGNETCIVEHGLTEEQWRIVNELDNFMGAATDSVVLDITSLPKRFFFPFLRQLLRRPTGELANLIVTYTIPESYTGHALAENFGDWAQLPLFSGTYTDERTELLIIGVGFEPLGLIERVETAESGRDLRFLLPFPAPVAAFHRSCNLLRRLQQHQPAQTFQVHRVDVRDASDAFDRLLSLTENGTKKADLAPFGPKPMSMGMCIYATLTDSEAFYTQPTVYHPDYSTGVSIRDGHRETYAYCVRIGGKDLYELPR